MHIPRLLPALLASVLATVAWAQTTGKPLNLKLPPSDIPAASSTAAKTADSAPGVYYGDTSGRMGRDEAATDGRADCDDSAYNQAKVHGSVGLGVMAGRRMSGNYQSGTVNLSKSFGSCDEPGGGISISVGAGSGHLRGREN
ncbi:MAG TPA: hypothetical protein VIL60_04570 [Rhodanobacter sp.]